eukprot:TRINITY_DN12618_c0_g1_i1.p1 TRINITY_DN12618_c0_g1~~TRINITY_DN12618_c0_g1_i1.p1  ORF type:complete len:668 (+),score=145.10 TRINITY_DN12618_c0_g1_i1:193-2004(+)
MAGEFGEALIDFDEFRENVLEDEYIHTWLTAACKREVNHTDSMHSIGLKHVEDVGVKVALGVLLMLLVLSLLSVTLTDDSGILVLEHLDLQARLQFGNWSKPTLPVPLQEQVSLWKDGLDSSSERGSLVYLDVGKRIICNRLKPGGQPCPDAINPDLTWKARISLEEIDDQIQDSEYRSSDLTLLRTPALDDVEITADELNLRVTAVALLDTRPNIESESIASVATTCLVISIILLGITTLTKDLSALSKMMLRPLKNLAEDMQSIAQLQLAGLSDDQNVKEDMKNAGAAEIRLIQKIFNNTKTAIRSWGKYVPWPVVQLLLSAGVDAKTGVNEVEVTMFFSDIAGFTSIVEKLVPEKSLLLLSRYFNDMSQVIDDHGGIVIEFIGDAICSVFGAPMANNYHPEACVRATLKMLRALDKINEWSKQRDLPNVGIRCGIHTGKVLVGNMGFHSRMKYGVVGENANVPARLEELNKSYGTNMLVSEATYDKLPPNLFVIRTIDWIYLRKADSEAQVVYQVMGRVPAGGKTHKLEKPCMMYDAALTLYKGKQFGKAESTFRKTNATFVELLNIKEDGPCKVMEKRCQFYRANPPPDDWNGVWDGPE